jgi:hypothetical protein
MRQIYFFAFLFLGVSNYSYGQIGNALNFDGVDDGISLTTLNLPLATSARTIEARIRTTQSTGGGAIVTYGDPTTSSGRFSLYQTSGSLNFVAEGNDYYTGIAINDGNWHHVAATYDGTTVKIYIDGALVASTTKTLNTISSEFSIGYRGVGNPSEYFNGDIDEVRIWNIVRTQSEISANQSAEISSSTSGLISYYKFNQGTANGTNTSVTTLTDELGINTGTLHNFALTGTTSNWIGSIISATEEIGSGSNGFKLFPNPVTCQFQINGIKETGNYQILNLLGVVVKSGLISDLEKIDVQNLAEGMYFFKLDKGSSVKFIKK